MQRDREGDQCLPGEGGGVQREEFFFSVLMVRFMFFIGQQGYGDLWSTATRR